MKIYGFIVSLTIVLCSCASRKEDKSITYTNTDGLKLRYEMEDGNTGLLYINDTQDSIPFTYTVVKRNEHTVDGKTKKYKITTIYEYHILYKENSESHYSILKDFKVLPTLERKKTFNYESHINQ
jgi:hypothetical protein